MNRGTIAPAAGAIAFLNACGMEIICTEGGFIVREAGSEADGFELTCDSGEELVDLARRKRDRCVNSREESGVGSPASVRGHKSFSQANGRCASPLDSAFVARLVNNKKEVLNAMKSRTQRPARAFTIEEFIGAFRPDGLGHIRMDDDQGKEVFDITFEEIICDICNCEIVQPEDDPWKKVVFVLEGYALCEECRERIREDESPLPIQTLKGGDRKMADEFNNKDTATLCPTKAGNGYKVVVNGTWFYTSKASLIDMVNGKSKTCTFSTIKDDEVVAQ